MGDASMKGWSLGTFRERRFCALAAAWFWLARHMKQASVGTKLREFTRGDEPLWDGSRWLIRSGVT